MRAVVATANVLAMILTLPCWLTARAEAAAGSGDDFYILWAQMLAGIPGFPGILLRRAYYRRMLAHCSARSVIGYGAVFTHRGATIEDHVYVGPYALVGRAHLREGSLIGSRASLVSAGLHHHPLPDGSWGTADRNSLQAIIIGPHAWIGEAAVVLADVLPGAMVAAGAVVSSPVGSGIMVAGNPARFVRHVRDLVATAERR
jgi:acetyltransferase-like isoleucine patch superfamily enzyme